MIRRTSGRTALPSGYEGVFDTGDVTAYDERRRVFTVKLDGHGQVLARCGVAGSLPNPDFRPRVLCVRTARMEWLILDEIAGVAANIQPPLAEEIGTDPFSQEETETVPSFRHATAPTDPDALEPRPMKGGDQGFVGRFGGIVGLFKSGAAILKSGFGCFHLMTKARRWITRARDWTLSLFGLNADISTTGRNEVVITAIVHSDLGAKVPLARVQAGTLQSPANVGAGSSQVSNTPTTKGIHIRLGTNVLLEYDATGNEVRVSFVKAGQTNQIRMNEREATLFRGAQFISMTDDGVMIKGSKIGLAGPVHLFGQTAAATVTPLQGFPTGPGAATVSFTDETSTVDFSTSTRFRNATTGEQEAAVLSPFLAEYGAALQALLAHTHPNVSQSVELAAQLPPQIASAAEQANTSSPPQP